MLLVPTATRVPRLVVCPVHHPACGAAPVYVASWLTAVPATSVAWADTHITPLAKLTLPR